MPVAATTYYINPLNGDNFNSGTDPNEAWANLARVSSRTFSPGDKILIKAGTSYTGTLAVQGEGAPGQPIVVDKYGDGPAPRIDGGGVWAALSVLNNTYLEINNLEITNTGPDAGSYRGVAVRLDDFGTAFNIKLKNLYIHDINGDPGRGIIFNCWGGGQKSRFDGILIENCRIEHTAGDGILVESNYHNRSDWYPNLNVVIRNNQLQDIGGDGIVLLGADGALVEGNVVNGAGRQNGDYAAGIWPWCSDNTVVQFNEICNVSGSKESMEFDSAYNCRNLFFQYNYSHDNEGGFMYISSNGSASSSRYSGCSNAVIRYNISQNDGTRLIHLSGDVTDTAVYNNTFYTGSQMDVYGVQTASYNGYPSNSSFCNNIFYAETGGSVNYQAASGANTGFENNVFYGTHLNMPYDPQYLTADPSLVAPGSGGVGINSVDGYKLKPVSPAIGSGRIIPGNGGRDYWGNQISDAAPSRGAHEPSTTADLNGDGVINFLDFSILTDSP